MILLDTPLLNGGGWILGGFDAMAVSAFCITSEVMRDLSSLLGATRGATGLDSLSLELERSHLDFSTGGRSGEQLLFWTLLCCSGEALECDAES